MIKRFLLSAVFALWVLPGSAWAFSVTITAQALSIQDPDHERFNLSSSIAIDHTLGPITSANGSVSEAFASSNLVTGAIRLYGETSGSTGVAGASGQMIDSITFSLPQGMASATIIASLSISGTNGLNGPGQGHASLSLGSASDSTGNAQPLSNILGQTLSVSLPVADGQTVQFAAYLTANSAYGGISSGFFDLTNTAQLSIELPEGVSYTSESGVLLSVPEPTTALLLACGLVGLGVRKRLH